MNTTMKTNNDFSAHSAAVVAHASQRGNQRTVIVGDTSLRRNQRSVTLGSVTHYIVTLGSVTYYNVTLGSVTYYNVTLGSVTHYVRAAAMLLTAATATI